MIKIVELAFYVWNVVACLNVELPIVEYNYQEDAGRMLPTDITKYLQMLSCSLLAICSLSCAVIILDWSVICRVRRLIKIVVPSKEVSGVA